MRTIKLNNGKIVSGFVFPRGMKDPEGWLRLDYNGIGIGAKESPYASTMKVSGSTGLSHIRGFAAELMRIASRDKLTWSAYMSIIKAGGMVGVCKNGIVVTYLSTAGEPDIGNYIEKVCDSFQTGYWRLFSEDECEEKIKFLNSMIADAKKINKRWND